MVVGMVKLLIVLHLVPSKLTLRPIMILSFLCGLNMQYSNFASVVLLLLFLVLLIPPVYACFRKQLNVHLLDKL